MCIPPLLLALLTLSGPAILECIVVIFKPGEVLLGLTVRDDVHQVEQFPLDASTGGHNGGKDSLG